MGRSRLSETKSLEKENVRLKKIVAELELDKLTLKRCWQANACILSEGKPEPRKTLGLTTEELPQVVIHTRQKLATSERRTCRVIGLAESSLQYRPSPKDDDSLRRAIIRLAKQYGRCGYRKVTELLHVKGWPPFGRLLCNRLPGNGSIKRRSSGSGMRKDYSFHSDTSSDDGFTTSTVPSSG